MIHGSSSIGESAGRSNVTSAPTRPSSSVFRQVGVSSAEGTTAGSSDSTRPARCTGIGVHVQVDRWAPAGQVDRPSAPLVAASAAPKSTSWLSR